MIKLANQNFNPKNSENRNYKQSMLKKITKGY